MNNGFVRVAAAIPELRVADCVFNALQMAELVRQAESEKVQVVCFPELSITGYPAQICSFSNNYLLKLKNRLSSYKCSLFRPQL